MVDKYSVVLVLSQEWVLWKLCLIHYHWEWVVHDASTLPYHMDGGC